MPLLLILVAVTASLALGAWQARRREVALRARLEGLDQRLGQLHLRLEVAEQDLALALSRTGVAEGLLLEKGIADEDEVEDMRRRLVTDGVSPREGEAIH
jgi:hypothetical protein